MSTSSTAQSSNVANRPGPVGEQRPMSPSDRDKRLASIQPGVSVPAMTGAILVFVLGVLLGVSNQVASGTPNALRVPALLAALLMVAQGVIGVRRALVAAPKTTRPMGAAYGRPVSAVTALPKPKASGYMIPMVVMGLAVWLGLANLNVDAPTDLTTYSLISSFALFAIAWTVLPARN
jgi:hypothetical protein